MTMKKILSTLFVLLFVSASLVAQDTKPKSNKETTVFEVSMHCESCKKKIEKNIAYEKGVSDLKVDLDKKTVAVEYRTDKTSPEKLIAAFEKLGYEAAQVVKTDELPQTPGE